jgi:hypothetical protein
VLGIHFFISQIQVAIYNEMRLLWRIGKYNNLQMQRTFADILFQTITNPRRSGTDSQYPDSSISALDIH